MTTLYPYQREGVLKIETFLGRALLADEPGLGKSIQALYWAANYEPEGPWVVVCPANLKWHWEREVAQHLHIHASILEGKDPRLGRLPGLTSKIYIINYDILRGRWVGWLRRQNPKLIIIDEGHYIKNESAKRSQHVRDLCQGVPNVVILTGTPILSRPAELWNLVNLVKPQDFDAWLPFAIRHCGPDKKPWGWEYKGATHLDELHQRLLASCMIRRRKSEVLNQLPDKILSVIPMDLDDRGEYREAVFDFFAWIKREGGWEAAKSAEGARALVQLGHLKRLAARLKLRAALSWYEDWLEDTDEKMIIFAVHHKILDSLYERFQHTAVLVDGSVTGQKRQLLVDRFTKDKRVRLFIGQLQATGVGWNGTAAQAVSFCELGWTPSEMTQASDRPHRIGQTKKVNVYFLVGRDTIEEKLCKLIQEKAKNIGAAIDGKKYENFDIHDRLVLALQNGESRGSR